jgi:predicted enzyme related to lactoylglutathione lyase
MAGRNLMALQFDSVGIVSTSPEDSLKVAAFFRDILHCPIEGDPLEGYAEAIVGTARVELHVGARADVGPHGGTVLHLTTDDVDAEVAAIRDRGAVIAAEPDDMPWGRSAYVAGPNRVMIEIYRPSPD